jgi:hypothetical protein
MVFLVITNTNLVITNMFPYSNIKLMLFNKESTEYFFCNVTSTRFD